MLEGSRAFGLGFLRADEMMTVMGWRVDQLANLALGVVGVVVLCALVIRIPAGMETCPTVSGLFGTSRRSSICESRPIDRAPKPP